MAPGPVVLVGCGNMGHALLAGWRARGTQAGDLIVVEPDSERAAAAMAAGVRVVADPAALPGLADAAAVVFAVKPQLMATVAPAYAAASAAAVFVSIAAGIATAALRRLLGAEAAVVRAMPNTPAQIGCGITAAYACPGVTDAQRTLASDLLQAAGEVAWLDDEALMDPVTAVSGSGPAYVFLLAECLADAGSAAGLPPPLAARLARQTVIGAGALLAHAPEAAATLRRQVTSPGGTTAAALAILDGPDGLRPLLARAVAAATNRARELGTPAAPPPPGDAPRTDQGG